MEDTLPSQNHHFTCEHRFEYQKEKHKTSRKEIKLKVYLSMSLLWSCMKKGVSREFMKRLVDVFLLFTQDLPFPLLNLLVLRLKPSFFFFLGRDSTLDLWKTREI